MRLLMAILFLTACSVQAEAKIQVCNKFKHPIYLVIAYQQGDDWISEGWTEVDTNQCVNDIKHADVTSFYYYAETDVFNKQSWSWGKGKQFSIKDNTFTLHGADKPQDNARFVGFSGPNTYKFPATQTMLEFGADLSNSFLVPPENSTNAEQASAPDANARDACDNQRGDVSIAGCTALISRNPNDAVAYLHRAVEYYNKNDYDRALADYSQAIIIKPDYTNAYFNRGLIYFQQKNDISHAIADFTDAIDLNSTYALTWRGVVYKAIGANDLALTDLNAAVNRDPKYSTAFYFRGVLYAMIGRKDNAIADFRQALVLDPNDQDSKDALKQLSAKP